MRIALLSYRSKPHCGGQGVYVRHLSRELVALGHEVEVFSGQPYPDLDAGVRLTKVPSLDLYREPDPFRMPRPSEFRDWIDVAEWATMCAAGFPEPLTFTLRAARHLLPRAGEFDVVAARRELMRRLPAPLVPRLAVVDALPVRTSGKVDRDALPALADLAMLRATPEGAVRIRNGNPGQVTGSAAWGDLVWVSDATGPVCIGRYQGGTVQPERVFNL